MAGRAGGRYRRRLAQEHHAAAVYRALAAKRTGEDREILLALARAEERHATHWLAKLHPTDRRSSHPGWRTRLLGWLARRLGSLVVLGLVQRAEAAGDYDADAEATAAMAADERVHAAGLAGLLAGALSMAAGEYVSVRSQRELLETTAHQLDPTTLATLRDQEAGELALVFRARGMPPDQAEQRAAELLGDRQAPAPEVEADQDVIGSAGAAAGSSFVAFASGAVVPLVPFFVTAGRAAITTAGVLVGVALFATGATVGVLTGGPLLRRGLRQLAVGAAAALITYALGRLFGATLG